MSRPYAECRYECYEGHYCAACQTNQYVDKLEAKLEAAEKSILSCDDCGGFSVQDDGKRLQCLHCRLEAIEKTIKAEQDYSIYWRKRAEAAEKRATACHHRAMTAEATIKEISELIAYYRDIDAENPDETIRMIAVADELQTILNRSKS